MIPRLIRSFLDYFRPSAPVARWRLSPLGLELLEAREVPAIIYGLGAVNQIYQLDSNAPSAPVSPIQVTGLGPLEVLIGLDFSPNYDALYGFTVPVPPPTSGPPAVVKLYKIDPLTRVATLVSLQSNLPNTGDVATGVSFDPSNPFSIRFVNANNENAHVSGNAFVDDPNLNPVGSAIIAAAYDAASTPTLYGISRATSSLVTIDGNTGAIKTVGSLGITLDAGADGGFDIIKSADNNGHGTALATLTVGGLSALYNINLITGAATFVGFIGGFTNPNTLPLRSIALAPDSTLVVGSGQGAAGDVRILDPDSSRIRQAIVPFAGFAGGVRVAAGDITGDFISDAIVSADAPQGHIKAFNAITGAELYSFFAFANFQGTVNIGSGDVNGDGFADILVIANGVNGHVKAFSGADGSLLASFLAYPGFGGVSTIAATDFDHDGIAEIVTVAGFNGHVKAFRADGSLFNGYSFLAFAGFPGTVNVAAGELLTLAGVIPTIVVASGAGTRGHVKVFDGRNLTQLASFFALDPGVTSGAFVALADANSDGVPDIRVTPGVGVPATVQAFSAITGLATGPRFPAFTDFLGGATVAGARF